MPELVHGTAIAIGSRAALIRGPSGSGKSDLALRCLAAGPSSILREPVHLIADDQILLTRDGPRLIARAPDSIRGKLEVRGVGIVEVASADEAEVALVVDLDPAKSPPRLPDPVATCLLLGLARPVLVLSPFEASAPAKLLIALASSWGL